MRLGINNDHSCFEVFLTYLNEDLITANIVNAISLAPPGFLYVTLKNILLKNLTDTQEQCFRKLMSGLHLDDRCPLQLLHEMHKLNRNQLNSAFVRTLWLDRLPRDVQLALISARNNSDEYLAILADNTMAILQSAQNQDIFVASSTIAQSHDSEIADLKKTSKLACKSVKN